MGVTKVLCVPLAAHCPAPITSLRHPSTHSITLGTRHTDMPGCASLTDKPALRQDALASPPPNEGYLHPFPDPAAEPGEL